MSPARMARVESTIRTVMRFHEALTHGDLASMLALMSDDCVVESSGPSPDGNTYTGKPALERFWQTYLAETRDSRRQIEDVFSIGIRCVLRWRAQWTDLKGIPRAVRGVDIFQVKEARITEILTYVKG